MFDKQKTFLNENLPKVITEMKGAILAGGTITSVLTKSDINDYDLYFKNNESLVDGIVDLLHRSYFIVHASNKAITFALGDEKVQVIHYRTFENAQDIFKDFDFDINMCAYDLDTSSLIVDNSCIEGLVSRDISFNQNTRYPLISMIRMKKYQDRGYNLTTKTQLELGLAISKLNIDSWESFIDQLGGVYGDIDIQENAEELQLPFTIDAGISMLGKLVKKSETMIEYMTKEDFIKKTGITDTKVLSELETEFPW